MKTFFASARNLATYPIKLALLCFIETEASAQWTALARDVNASYLTYFQPVDFVTNGVLSIPASKVSIPFYYTYFNYATQINLPRKFSVEIRTSNTSISAYDTYLGLTANGKLTYIRFMGDSWALPYTSLSVEDRELTRNTNFLLQNLSEYRTLRIEVDNEALTVAFYFEGRQVYHADLTERMCSLSGLDIRYKGSGQCDWLKLTDERNEVVLLENFNSATSFASPKFLADLCSVVPPDKIYIPDVFTPNGDGTNDLLEIRNAGVGTEVWIYTRWGEVIFHSKGYAEPWNGTYRGSPVPLGSYQVRVKHNGFTHYRAVLVVR